MPAQLNGPAKNVAISTHSEYEAAANGKARSSEPNDSAARLIVYTYASVLQIEHAFISFCSARIIFKTMSMPTSKSEPQHTLRRSQNKMLNQSPC